MPAIGTEFREDWEDALKNLFNMDVHAVDRPAICSLHFEPDSMYFQKGKTEMEFKLKQLKRGALPTIGAIPVADA